MFYEGKIKYRILFTKFWAKISFRRITVFFIFFITNISAQEGMTLLDAWQITLKNNYSLQQQEKIIARALEEISIQKTTSYPGFNFSTLYNYKSQLAKLELPFLPGETIEAGVKSQYDVAVSLTQSLFSGFRTRNLINMAREQQMAQTIQKKIIRNQLLLQVALLYYDIQLNLLQQDVLTESKSRAENQLKLLLNALNAQQATPFDTLEVANRKLQITTQLSNLVDIFNILISKMEYLLNSEINKSIERIIVNDLNLNLGSLNEYLMLALSSRSELMQNISMQRAQFYKIGAEKANFYPQVFSALSYHYARPGVNFFKDEWMDYYSFMVQLQWDFWNWGRNKRKTQQARLDYEQSQLKNEELKQDIQQQVKEVYRYLQSAHNQINLQEQLVKQEEERFRITQDMYRQGMTTAIELSNAEHALTEAKLNLQLNYISWFKHKSQLEFACGTIGANVQEVNNEK